MSQNKIITFLGKYPKETLIFENQVTHRNGICERVTPTQMRSLRRKPMKREEIASFKLVLVPTDGQPDAALGDLGTDGILLIQGVDE